MPDYRHAKGLRETAGVSDPKDFSYLVFWSEADHHYIGRCGPFPALSAVGRTRGEALHEIVRLVGEALRQVADSGEPMPG